MMKKISLLLPLFLALAIVLNTPMGSTQAQEGIAEESMQTDEDESDAPSDLSSMPNKGQMEHESMDQMMGRGMMGGCMPLGEGMGMLGHGRMGHGRMGHDRMAHQKAMMEGRLAYIKTALEITDAQKTVWDDYANIVRTRSTAQQEIHHKMRKDKQSGTAAERLEARIKNLEARLENLKTLKSPTESLYNVLTENQKKKADLLLGKGHCMM